MSVKSQSTVDEPMQFISGDLIVITNSFDLKIRPEKLAAQILHITRSRVSQLEQSKILEIKKNNESIEILLLEDLQSSIVI
jgi:hypothetical protein